MFLDFISPHSLNSNAVALTPAGFAVSPRAPRQRQTPVSLALVVWLGGEYLTHFASVTYKPRAFVDMV